MHLVSPLHPQGHVSLVGLLVLGCVWFPSLSRFGEFSHVGAHIHNPKPYRLTLKRQVSLLVLF